jgi:hypothetical protein
MVPETSYVKLQRAAAAYRHALKIKEGAGSLAAEFPNVAAKLDEAAKLLITEGKKAEMEG